MISRIANTKIAFIFVTLSLLIFQDVAYSIPTKWEDAQISLSGLLNSGWQISGHGTSRVATSPGASGYSPYDIETFSFLLIKNNKYIICFIENPKPPIANAAGCRKLN
jgi:hypothetical protein